MAVLAALGVSQADKRWRRRDDDRWVMRDGCIEA